MLLAGENKNHIDFIRRHYIMFAQHAQNSCQENRRAVAAIIIKQSGFVRVKIATDEVGTRTTTYFTIRGKSFLRKIYLVFKTISAPCLQSAKWKTVFGNRTYAVWSCVNPGENWIVNMFFFFSDTYVFPQSNNFLNTSIITMRDCIKHINT